MDITNEPSSAVTTVYEWLLSHINRLPMNESQFIAETEVAKATGISRTPVREALIQLEGAGLLRRIPRRGAYIPELSRSEIEEVMDTRRMIELWSVKRIPDETRDLLLADLEALLNEQRLNATNPHRFIELDRQFHATIVSAAGSTLLNTFYETVRARQVRMGVNAVTRTPARTQRVIQEHESIFKALREPDGASVTSAIERHLANSLATMRQSPPTTAKLPG